MYVKLYFDLVEIISDYFTLFRYHSAGIDKKVVTALFFLIVWYIVFGIQVILSYGTAYRLTKRGGDNGASLFGWLIAMEFASVIPGLGIYLWIRYRGAGEE